MCRYTSSEYEALMSDAAGPWNIKGSDGPLESAECVQVFTLAGNDTEVPVRMMEITEALYISPPEVHFITMIFVYIF